MIISNLSIAPDFDTPRADSGSASILQADNLGLLIIGGAIIALIIITIVIHIVIRRSKRVPPVKDEALIINMSNAHIADTVMLPTASYDLSEDTMELPDLKDLIKKNFQFTITQDITYVHTNERIR